MNQNQIFCEHKNTRIWEPHLAGARKCNDCGMAYNPNRRYSGADPWFVEPPSLEEQLETERSRNKKLVEALKHIVNARGNYLGCTPAHCFNVASKALKENEVTK